MNNLALVQVTLFKNGTKLDRNDNPAHYLNVLAGTLPKNARVISGTGAVELYNLQVGKLYTVVCDTVKAGEGEEYDKHSYTFLESSAFADLFAARKLAGVPVRAAASTPKVETPENVFVDGEED